MKIYKYKIEIINKWFKMSLPENFKPLAFQCQPTFDKYSQGGPICMWAMVDVSQNAKEFSFIAIGTGIEFDPQGATYIGTAQQEGFMWHLFCKY